MREDLETPEDYEANFSGYVTNPNTKVKENKESLPSDAVRIDIHDFDNNYTFTQNIHAELCKNCQQKK